jgi:hypothetical protein
MMMQMPTMQMCMPMMEPMTMSYEEDDRDEEYFAGMYSDACHHMMPYVMRTVDRMEQKGDMIYEARPEREMVDRMTEETYSDLISDMPDMADEMSEERQYGRRRFTRDLLGLLLISELLRRRRRRRRRHPYYGYDYDYGFDNDFYYYD